MKYKILILTILLLPLTVLAAIDFNGTPPAKPHGSAGGLDTSNLQGMCWFISPDNVASATRQEVFNIATAEIDFEPIEFYIQSSTLNFLFNAFCLFGNCNEAHFTVPISNGNQVVCIDFNFVDPDIDTPSVWINGVKSTVTTLNVGDGAAVFTLNDYLYVGSDDSGNYGFDGRMSTITLFTSSLSENQLRALSSTRDKKQLLDGQNAYFQWRLDERPPATFTATTTYPNNAGISSLGKPTTTLDFRENASSVLENYMSN